MSDMSAAAVFLNASLVNNFVLAYFLGICPFLGVSGKVDTSLRMGAAVTFVMLLSSLCAFALHRLLELIGAPYLELIAYIVVIASAVQLVELFIKKTSPGLFKALGVYLPLITTNCAILAVALFQTNRGYDLLQSLCYALGAGAGFTLALLLIAGIRERLALGSGPELARGLPTTLVVAGILSLGFMGFAGMGSPS
jgi:electron transport complex protein RnfA